MPYSSPMDRDLEVTLREVTKETVRAICDLKVSSAQENYVASNAISIAEAYFTKEAWFRAIYAGDTPVGFVMLYDDPNKGEYYLWRYMIDTRYQGQGYGKKALEALINHVRSRPNATELFLSYVPGEGSPVMFEILSNVVDGDSSGEFVLSDAIDESHILNHILEQFCALELEPSLFCCQGELEHQGEHRFSGEVVAGLGCAEPDGGEGRLNGIGGPDVLPVPGGKVVEGQEDVTVFA